MSVNIFCLSVFVCEFTFGQLSVGELSHNGFEMFKNIFFFMSGREILHFRVKLIGLYIFHPLFLIFISIKWCENQYKML